MDTRQPSPARPGLLRLPPELRNAIYEYTMPEILFFTTPRRLRSPMKRTQARVDTIYGPSRFSCRKPSIPVLLQTCHTFRKEAFALYFDKVILVLDISFALVPETMAWLKATPLPILNDLRAVMVVGDLLCSPRCAVRKHTFSLVLCFFLSNEAVHVAKWEPYDAAINGSWPFSQENRCLAERRLEQAVEKMEAMVQIENSEKKQEKAAFVKVVEALGKDVGPIEVEGAVVLLGILLALLPVSAAIACCIRTCARLMLCGTSVVCRTSTARVFGFLAGLEGILISIPWERVSMYIEG
ncbi:hypothetical protein LTR17_001041 [Elasticomyces elasticus]|nr:hypothetical protein LTR17_001041 [Elasticomyces elasticus]